MTGTRDWDFSLPERARHATASDLWDALRPSLRLDGEHPEEDRLFSAFSLALQSYVLDRRSSYGGPPLSAENGPAIIARLSPKGFTTLEEVQQLARTTRSTLAKLGLVNPDNKRVWSALAWQMNANATPEFVDAWQKEFGRLTTPERLALKSPPEFRQGDFLVYAAVNDALLRLDAACTELLKKNPKTKSSRHPAVYALVEKLWRIWRQTPAAEPVLGAGAANADFALQKPTPTPFLAFVRRINETLAPAALSLAVSDVAVADTIRSYRRSLIDKHRQDLQT